MTEWRLQPGERITKAASDMAYVAACPTCGADAKFTDVLVHVMSATSTARTIVQCRIDCPDCGPDEIEVEDAAT